MTTEAGGPYGTMDVLAGTEFLSSIESVAPGQEAGDILATLAVNPRSFDNTRLYQFSLLYQRYRFRKLQFFYKPIANATESGQLIGFGDYDPDNILSGNSPSNLSVAAAHLGQRTGKIWETINFPFGIVDDYTTLFIEGQGADPRLSVQGIYYLIAASSLATGALGNLYIAYEIELYIPLVSEIAITGQATPSLTLLSSASGTGVLTKPLGDAPLPNPVITGVDPYPSSSLTFAVDPIDVLSVDVAYNSTDGSLQINKARPGDLWQMNSALFVRANWSLSATGSINYEVDESSTASGGTIQYMGLTGSTLPISFDGAFVYSALSATLGVGDSAAAGTDSSAAIVSTLRVLSLPVKVTLAYTNNPPGTVASNLLRYVLCLTRLESGSGVALPRFSSRSLQTRMHDAGKSRKKGGGQPSDLCGSSCAHSCPPSESDLEIRLLRSEVQKLMLKSSSAGCKVDCEKEKEIDHRFRSSTPSLEAKSLRDRTA